MSETMMPQAFGAGLDRSGWPGEGDQALLVRLRDTARLIERMLGEDRRQRYFDALSQKRSGIVSGNVTALFFSEPSGAAFPDG